MCDRYTGTFEILKSDIERYPELKKPSKTNFIGKKNTRTRPKTKTTGKNSLPLPTLSTQKPVTDTSKN